MIRLRRYLVAGLLVWLPVGATILVFRLLLGLMERLLFWLPADYRPEALIGFNVPGLNAAVAAALAAALLLTTGVFAANFLGRRLVSTYESLLSRIPLVRSVYSAVKQIAEVVFSDSNSSFTRVLMIEYPRKGTYCIVFQTSENAPEVQSRTGEPIVTVFLPTTPNPTSGFILFVPRRDVIPLDMTVEEALKMIVSLGVVVPSWHEVHPDQAAAESTPVPFDAAGSDEPAAARIDEPAAVRSDEPAAARSDEATAAQGEESAAAADDDAEDEAPVSDRDEAVR